MNWKAFVLTTLVLSIVPWRASAQSCPEFEEAAGAEIVISTDDVYRKYNFLSFGSAPEIISRGVAYDEIAGRRAKIGEVVKNGYGSTFRRVIIEDCRTFYLSDFDDQLDASDGLAAGFRYITLPQVEWLVQEKVDPMDDEKTCQVTAKGDTPFPIFLYSNRHGFMAAVVGSDFPGRPDSFRVDRNKAISGVDGINGAQAQSLVAQIRAGGKRLLVSGAKWPYETVRVQEFGLNGLVEKLDHCKAWVR